MGQEEFRLFRDMIHRHTGIWLRDNKQVMLASRLARRLREHSIGSFADYYDFVEACNDGGVELGELINCVTTNKTSFFRERHHFEFLSEKVMEEIARRPQTSRTSQDSGAATGKTLRIWSAACSTGEEPYSIAITLLDKLSRFPAGLQSGWDLRVVGSDIDTKVLAAATRGVYSSDVLNDIDPELRCRYFLRGKENMNGYVRVKREVLDLVVFQRINLMDSSWPLSGTFDVVFFRNALIYFKQETQDLFLRRIVRHIKPGGYLFLGHSEHIPWLQGILEPLRNTIYRVRGSVR